MLKNDILKEIDQSGLNDEAYNQVTALLNNYGDELDQTQEEEFFQKLKVIIQNEQQLANFYREMTNLGSAVNDISGKIDTEYQNNLSQAYQETDQELTDIAAQAATAKLT